MTRTLTNSNTFKERAKKVVPHLTGTFSRAAPSYVEGVFPVYVQNAHGSHFIDVDENQTLASQYGVRSVPTTVIEENGVEVDRFIGALPKQEVIQRLNG